MSSALACCHAINRGLPFEPCGEIDEAVVEVTLRGIAEYVARRVDVGVAMPNVADTILAADLRRNVLLVDDRRRASAISRHRVVLAAADVEHFAIRGGRRLRAQGDRPARRRYTLTKSRCCSPSSKIFGALSFNSRAARSRARPCRDWTAPGVRRMR